MFNSGKTSFSLFPAGGPALGAGVSHQPTPGLTLGASAVRDFQAGATAFGGSVMATNPNGFFAQHSVSAVPAQGVISHTMSVGHQSGSGTLSLGVTNTLNQAAPPYFGASYSKNF